MTKEIFMDIVKSNLTAEYINSTRAFAKGERVCQPSSVLTLAPQLNEKRIGTSS